MWRRTEEASVPVLASKHLQGFELHDCVLGKVTDDWSSPVLTFAEEVGAPRKPHCPIQNKACSLRKPGKIQLFGIGDVQF